MKTKRTKPIKAIYNSLCTLCLMLSIIMFFLDANLQKIEDIKFTKRDPLSNTFQVAITSINAINTEKKEKWQT